MLKIIKILALVIIALSGAYCVAQLDQRQNAMSYNEMGAGSIACFPESDGFSIINILSITFR